MSLYRTKEQLKMHKVFGVTNGNLLMRNRLFSVEEVKRYIEKYPFDKYKKYHAIYYRGIGPERYKQIVDKLNKIEEES